MKTLRSIFSVALLLGGLSFASPAVAQQVQKVPVAKPTVKRVGKLEHKPGAGSGSQPIASTPLKKV